MVDQRQTRNRAVRLTEAALDGLNATLHDRWAKGGSRRKLTWEVRSDMMGVRVATARKVLGRVGVDRATLTFIYKNLDIAWNDSYCEPTGADSDTEPPQSPSHQLPQSSSPARGPLFFPLALLSGVLILVLVFVGYRSLTRDREQPVQRVDVLTALATAEMEYHKGNYSRATNLATGALNAARQDDSATYTSYALRVLGDLAAVSGDYKRASDMYEQALTVKDVIRDARARPDLLEALAGVEVKQGLFDRAELHYSQSLSDFRKFRDAGGISMACRGLGEVAYKRKDYDKALDWFEMSLSSVKGHKGADLIETDVRSRQALVYAGLGRIPQARAMLKTCLEFWRHRKHPRWIAQTQVALASVELKAGNKATAESLAKSSKTLFEGIGDVPGVSDSNRLINLASR